MSRCQDCWYAPCRCDWNNAKPAKTDLEIALEESLQLAREPIDPPPDDWHEPNHPRAQELGWLVYDGGQL